MKDNNKLQLAPLHEALNSLNDLVETITEEKEFIEGFLEVEETFEGDPDATAIYETMKDCYQELKNKLHKISEN